MAFPLTPAVAVAAIPVSPIAPVAARLGLGQQSAPALRGIQDFALVQPRFDADHAVRGLRFGKAVIDIGAQGVQRQFPRRSDAPTPAL